MGTASTQPQQVDHKNIHGNLVPTSTSAINMNTPHTNGDIVVVDQGNKPLVNMNVFASNRGSHTHGRPLGQT